jgi:glutaminyl-peptide cyclotransferase
MFPLPSRSACRTISLTLASLPFVAACSGSASGPIDGERAMAHVRFLCKFGPRPAGSRELTQAADYIKTKLRDLGLQPQEQRWREDKLNLDLQNLWVQIDGQDPANGDILLVAAHYDTKLCAGHPTPTHNFPFVGAMDGTGGPALLLELARHFKERKSVPNVWLVWFDGEENVEFDWNKTNDHKALLGSRYFVRTMGADKTRFPRGLAARIKTMVLLDLIGDKNQKVDKDTNSATELLELFGAVGKQMGKDAKMFHTSSPITDDHKPFVDVGVRAINLIDFHYRIPAERGRPGEPPPAVHPDYKAWWHTKDDVPEQMAPESLKFIGDLVWLAIPEVEKRFYGVK